MYDDKFDWPSLACCFVYPILVACNRMRIWHVRESDKEYDKDCVNERLQLDKTKLDSGGQEGQVGVGVQCFGINICDGVDLGLA